MGGGPAKDVVLIALPVAEPKDLMARLRSQHPQSEFRFRQVSWMPGSKKGKGKSGGNVEAEVKAEGKGSDDSPEEPEPSWFEDVTVLGTFNAIPDPSSAPRLALVQLFSAGSNHIASSPLYKETEVPIATASGIHTQIAEWVLMTLLVHSHKYHQLYELQKRAEWGKGADGRSDFRDVRDQVGRRLGVLGYGSIGRQVANVGRALGMEVVAFTAGRRDTDESKKDRGFIVPGTGDPDGKIPVEWFSGLDKASLHRFLASDIDVLLISVPLTDATKGFLGKEEFGVLSQGGKTKPFLLNIARGPIIKQDELIDALKDGTLSGAALDVTDPEPLPSDSELWRLPNVIVTPHIAGNGTMYIERAFTLVDEQLKRKEKGESLLNLVKRSRGY